MAVWLHGFGADPEIAGYQDLATELGIAFLGVSGTVPHGPSSFAWANDHAKDQRRIDAAFAEVEDRLKPEAGKIALFGFSQGAATSAELSALHPGRYAGAIVMSPGSQKPSWLPDAPKEGTDSLTYVIACGAGEHPGNVKRSLFYARGLERLGAKVKQKLYAEQDRHTFPPDFEEMFPAWLKEILEL